MGEAVGEVAAGEQAGRSPSILIVDDNAQNLELMEAFLEGSGAQVAFASDGGSALEAAAASPPDLMILDIMMPRTSGYQVCERMRADASMAGVPVLVVTALGEVNDVERAMDAGADDFLTKPVNREELLVRVKALLERGRRG